MWWLIKAMAKMKSEHWTKDEIGVLELYNLRSECKLNSGPFSSVG